MRGSAIKLVNPLNSGRTLVFLHISLVFTYICVYLYICADILTKNYWARYFGGLGKNGTFEEYIPVECKPPSGPSISFKNMWVYCLAISGSCSGWSGCRIKRKFNFGLLVE